MLQRRRRPIEYPTSDGRPLGETDVHRVQIVDLIHGLDVYFKQRSDVYVTGNLLLLYEENRPRKHLSPDVMVVFGVPKHNRENYLLWKEGKAPDVAIEVTSKSTRDEDMGHKKGLYAMMGVAEYYLFDPLREYLSPRLKAYRLEGADYLPVVSEPLVSPRLGLELVVVDDRLRLRDAARDVLLPTLEETAARAEQAEREAERRRALEAEVEDLRKALRERCGGSEAAG